MGPGDSAAVSTLGESQDHPSPSDAPDPIHVLHVDDEQAQVELAVEFFERADAEFTVETASSPEEGLAVLADSEIDCIISDYDMPGMDGLEFFDTVTAEHPAVPFILFTGKGSEEVASRAVSAGVTEYMEKGGADQYDRLVSRVREIGSARIDGSPSVDFPLDNQGELLDLLPTACYVSLDRELVHVNSTFVDLFGHSREALLDGMSLADLCVGGPEELDEHRPPSAGESDDADDSDEADGAEGADDGSVVSYRIEVARANGERFTVGIRERRAHLDGRPVIAGVALALST